MEKLMLKRFFVFFVLVFSVSISSLAQAVELDLNQYKGKVVYLDFWASWCVPCRHSFPWMNKMQQELSDKGLVIIAVNLDEEQKEAAAFLRAVPADFKVIYDPEGQLANEYKVKGMPSSYIFDRSGKLVKSHIGFKNKDAASARKYIESLLNR